VLSGKILKTIADGLVMSKFRYCASVWGTEYLRTEVSDPTSSAVQSLQIIENNVLRLITGHRKSEHIKIEDMLRETGFLSINQIIAYTTLMEAWKAKTFDIPLMNSVFSRSREDTRTLRSDTNGAVSYAIDEPFARAAAGLWNSASSSFKTTNLLVNAKTEAKKLVLTLPI